MSKTKTPAPMTEHHRKTLANYKIVSKEAVLSLKRCDYHSYAGNTNYYSWHKAHWRIKLESLTERNWVNVPYSHSRYICAAHLAEIDSNFDDYRVVELMRQYNGKS